MTGEIGDSYNLQHKQTIHQSDTLLGIYVKSSYYDRLAHALEADYRSRTFSRSYKDRWADDVSRFIIDSHYDAPSQGPLTQKHVILLVPYSSRTPCGI